MTHPDIQRLRELLGEIARYGEMKRDLKAPRLRPELHAIEASLRHSLKRVRKLAPHPDTAAHEPSDLKAIRAQRPDGPRRLWERFEAEAYRPRLRGALLGRCAGCTLGAPVEGWAVDRMRAWAAEVGDAFPPVDYWARVADPDGLRYGKSRRREFSRGGMDGVPVDDDIAYTLLGLLILEGAGPGFTTEDVGAAWLDYLPIACTAERAALENLRQGVPAAEAAERNNPYQHWIGADIRSDPWGYAAPGRPERAAAMAHADAWLSHRRMGIHGAMFFAAAIAAAFAVDSPEEALQIGLTEIPEKCALAKDIRWALRLAPRLTGYADARAAVDERFDGLSVVHTNNNACLTVFGLLIGGRDVTRVIGETVAMGMDNDCTAATAGSIVGALVGAGGIPEQWTRPFGNTVKSYLNRHPRFTLDGLCRRFEAQARQVFAS